MEGDGSLRAPSKKPCRFFHQNDCFRGDKCHMVHAPKDKLAPCKTHQYWLEDPWTRPACEWNERCARLHVPYSGPNEPELLRTNIALQTENSQLARVRAYVTGVLGGGGEASDTGIARSGTSRYKQKLALLEARDPEEFSRRCVADTSLCRSLLRVYLLGGGVCTSLEDVGKKVSADVAAGKYSGAGSPTEGFEGGRTGADATVAAASLCVRVQALPKVMERQLVDEDSTFWTDHFPGLVRERQAGAFTHVLSVVFVRGAFLFGIAEAATHGRSIIENNNEDSPVCRAFYKIKEVSSRAAICYDRRWTAIDIGSAPGGWTSFLAPRCRRVLSVDPAELDPSVLALPNVVHVQQVIEAAKDTLLGLLAGPWPEGDGAEPTGSTVGESNGATPTTIGGDAPGVNGVLGVKRAVGAPEEEVTKAAKAGFAKSPETAAQANVDAAPACQEEDGVPAAKEAAPGADLIVSDMNAEPRVVADVLLATLAAGLAKPGALVVATLKDFCGRKKRMRDEVAIALSRLRAGTGQDGRGNGNGGGGGGIVAGYDGDDDLRRINGGLRTEEEGGSAAVVPVNGNPGGAGGGGVPGDDARDLGVGSRAVPEAPAPIMPEIGWRLEAVETMKLLAGGQAEVTIVARVGRGPFPV